MVGNDDDNEGTMTTTDFVSDTDGPPPHPALLNDVVLSTVFNFMDFTTLKRCRIVCSKWKSVCEASFRKQAKLVVYQFSCNVDYLKMLFSRADSDVTFSSLTLKGVDSPPWKSSDLEEFLNNEGMSITELEFDAVQFEDEEGNHCESIDLSRFITANLRRLKVDDNNYQTFGSTTDPRSYSLSLDAQLPMDYISLSCCKIILNGKSRISPKEIVLDGSNHYFKNGTKLHGSINLHKIINFQRLEKLTICDEPDQNEDNFISVDFQGTFSVRFVELNMVTEIKNWQKSQWRINELKLVGLNFIKKTKMSITKLEVWGSRVNLSVLPVTIETLILGKCDKIRCSSTMFLPNLKYLTSVRNGNLNFLTHFMNCDSLTELSIYSGEREEGSCEIRVNTLPKNLSKVFLYNDYNDFKLVGKRAISLDTLILAGCIPDHDLHGWNFSKLRAKNLICLKTHPWNFSDDFLQKLIALSENQCETVTVGSFKWSSEQEFSDSFLTNYVDKQSECYSFKDGRGEAVTSTFIRDKRLTKSEAIDIKKLKEPIIYEWDFPKDSEDPD